MKIIIACTVLSMINIYLYHVIVVSRCYTLKKDSFKEAFDVDRCIERLEGAAGKSVKTLPDGKWVRNGQLTWDTMVFVKEVGDE